VLAEQLWAEFFSDDLDDNNLPNIFASLSKDEKETIREMEPDFIEMAIDADEQNTPVGSYFPVFFYISSCSPTTKDFYCTLPASVDGVVHRFPASGSTSFGDVASAVYDLLPWTGYGPLPPLLFKLSTDPEDVPWEHLNSKDDWEYAIHRVRNQKARQMGEAKHGVDVQIGFCDTVSYAVQFVVELSVILIPMFTSGDEVDRLWVKHPGCDEKTRTGGPLATGHKIQPVTQMSILRSISDNPVYVLFPGIESSARNLEVWWMEGNARCCMTAMCSYPLINRTNKYTYGTQRSSSSFPIP